MAAREVGLAFAGPRDHACRQVHAERHSRDGEAGSLARRLSAAAPDVQDVIVRRDVRRLTQAEAVTADGGVVPLRMLGPTVALFAVPGVGLLNVCDACQDGCLSLLLA